MGIRVITDSTANGRINAFPLLWIPDANFYGNFVFFRMVSII